MLSQIVFIQVLARVPVPELLRMCVDGFCGKKNSFF
jgi:hypothetical protein